MKRYVASGVPTMRRESLDVPVGGRPFKSDGIVSPRMATLKRETMTSLHRRQKAVLDVAFGPAYGAYRKRLDARLQANAPKYAAAYRLVTVRAY